LLISVFLVRPSALIYLSGSLLLLSLVFISCLSLKYFLREFKFWSMMIFILFLLQIFMTPGTRLSLFPWLPISREGLRQGGFISWRLGLWLGYAFLFTAVTRPRDLTETLVWMLTPFPFVPRRRIALMVALTLRFFARFLDQMSEIRTAYLARLGEKNRPFIRKIKCLTLPLLRRSFLEVDEVTYALLARGYQETLPHRLPPIPFSHLIPLIILFGILLWSL
jgi:energy-coupling factor transporter transmembrane protein EcfT